MRLGTEEKLRNAILASYKAYIVGSSEPGKRPRNWYSSKNQKSPYVMHDALYEALKDSFQTSKVEVRTANHGGEYPLRTSLNNNSYKKNVDITLVDVEKSLSEPPPILGISFKMPLASVNKNLRNMGESVLGETALLKESGIPYYFFCIVDSFPICPKENYFDLEELSDKSLEIFTHVLKTPRSNLFRPNGLIIMKANFHDKIFKESHKKESFNTQEDKRKIGLMHLEHLESQKLRPEILTLRIDYGGAPYWDPDFDKCIQELFLIIEEEIKMAISKKNYF